jgi:hypothetical protein
MNRARLYALAIPMSVVGLPVTPGCRRRWNPPKPLRRRIIEARHERFSVERRPLKGRRFSGAG